MAAKLTPRGITGTESQPVLLPAPSGVPVPKQSPGMGSGASSFGPAADLTVSQFMEVQPDQPPTARILNAGALQEGLKANEEKESPTSTTARKDPAPLLPSDSPSNSTLAATPPLSLPAPLPATTPPLKSNQFNQSNEPREKEISAAYIVMKSIGRILQRVAVRSPHVHIGLFGLYIVNKIYINDDTFAIEAAIFIGVAGTVYCIARAAILEILPEWMLPQEPKYSFWRHTILITNTICITLTLTSAVWKLKISAIQGVACWAIPHALSYWFFSDRYPDIDKNNKWEKNELATKS